MDTIPNLLFSALSLPLRFLSPIVAIVTHMSHETVPVSGKLTLHTGAPTRSHTHTGSSVPKNGKAPHDQKKRNPSRRKRAWVQM